MRRIDRLGEREKAKAESRKRLAAALRDNLKRRKAGRPDKASSTPAPESEPPSDGKE